MNQRKKFLLKLLLLFSVFFIISAVLQKIFNIQTEQIQAYISAFGPIAPLIYALILFLGLSVPFNPIPDYAIVFTAGLIFPPFYSIWGTFIAHTATIALNYFIGKKFGWKALDIFAKESEMDYGHKLVKRITIREVFTLRWVLPMTAIGIDIVSYAAGMASLPFSKYFLASIIPWTILSILFFTSSYYLKQFSQILFFLPAVALIIISAIIFKLTSKNRR